MAVSMIVSSVIQFKNINKHFFVFAFIFDSFVTRLCIKIKFLFFFILSTVVEFWRDEIKSWFFPVFCFANSNHFGLGNFRYIFFSFIQSFLFYMFQIFFFLFCFQFLQSTYARYRPSDTTVRKKVSFNFVCFVILNALML